MIKLTKKEKEFLVEWLTDDLDIEIENYLPNSKVRKILPTIIKKLKKTERRIMEDIHKAKKVIKNAEQNIKEFGCAEINIALDDGYIRVEHIEGGSLAEWNAEKGDWDEIWKTLNKLVKKNNGFSLVLNEKEKA